MPQTVIPPFSLDENGLERLSFQMNALGRESGTLNLDLGGVEFIDPCGMVGLLNLGRHFSQRGHKLLLHLPISMEVQRCLDRMDFFRYLSESYIMYPPYRPLAARARRTPSSDALLEITRLSQSDDTHKMMEKVKERAGAVLEDHLHYKEEAVQGFLTALEQICQNIIEHSGNTGLVGIQKYSKEKHSDKNTVKVAVMDLGIGFKESLSSQLAPRYGGQWSDAAALEEAVLHGASRHREAGRGRGLAAVKNFAERWGAELSVRSGTAKLSLLPKPDHVAERETGLPEFPGVRISLILSEG